MRFQSEVLNSGGQVPGSNPVLNTFLTQLEKCGQL